MNQLQRIESFRHELAVAETYQDIKALDTKAAAIAEFAKRNKLSKDKQDELGVFRVEIEQKKGAWLEEFFPQGKSNQYTKKSARCEPHTLQNIGVDKHESANARMLKNEPERVNRAIERLKLDDKKVVTPSAIAIEVKRERREEVKKEFIELSQKQFKNLPENIKLLEGDLFEMIKQIPDKSVDLLNTDPPYSILNEKWDAFKNKSEYLDFTQKWLDVVMPKIKDTGRIYISCSQRFQYDFYELLKENDFYNFIFKQNIIWYYKNNNKPSSRKEYRYMYEPIFYLYGRNAPSLNFTPDTYGETHQNVWEIATPQINYSEGKVHAAQKPLELYRRIVKTGSYDGNTVLDCFAGSGTTGIVCKELNRKCILIERENIEIIKGRL